MRRKKAHPDYYDELGVPRGAALREIKRAYRRLAKKHHPDGKGETRSERFVRIQEAYDVLSNRRRRANYDRYGEPDVNEALLDRLKRENDPGGHPFLRVAMTHHLKRMERTGCPRCPDMETCQAWRERLHRIDCPKRR